MIYILCRRKTLPMPRICSWHSNQSIVPVNGVEVFDMMKPMYDMMNRGRGEDPWSYYAVIANAQRTVVTVRQKSRFGIGDVFFLASYFGKCEVVVDDIKRLKRTDVQLESGDILDDIDHIIKVLGFQADFKVDDTMQIKKMEGFHVNGDPRRVVISESPGIDAGKFGGTSYSPGALSWSDIALYFLNYPKDSLAFLGQNFLQTQKEGPDGYPCYIWGTRNGSSNMMVYGSIPGMFEIQANYGQFTRNRQLEMHPPEKTVRELEAEWKNYARLMGRQAPPYPYTVEQARDVIYQQDKAEMGQEAADFQKSIYGPIIDKADAAWRESQAAKGSSPDEVTILSGDASEEE